MEYQSFDEAQLGLDLVLPPFFTHGDDSEMSIHAFDNESFGIRANSNQYYETFLPELMGFHIELDSSESDSKFEIPGEPENVPGEPENVQEKSKTFLSSSQTLENIPVFIRIKKPSTYKKKIIAGPHVYMEEIKTSVPRFVAMLWKIVTCEPCCEWIDRGTMFGITNERQFINILSKYFKHSNFSSFRRQLSLYGFRQLKAGKMIWGHQNFNKYNIMLLSNLKRKLKI